MVRGKDTRLGVFQVEYDTPAARAFGVIEGPLSGLGVGPAAHAADPRNGASYFVLGICSARLDARHLNWQPKSDVSIDGKE